MVPLRKDLFFWITRQSIRIKKGLNRIETFLRIRLTSWINNPCRHPSFPGWAYRRPPDP